MMGANYRKRLVTKTSPSSLISLRDSFDFWFQFSRDWIDLVTRNEKSELVEKLVKEVLAPLIVRSAHQAHDVSAGMQVERTRFAQQFHICFGRKLITLVAIAQMAASDQIFPGEGAASGTRTYMVER